MVVRNEEDFAEKRAYSFNYAKLLVFFVMFLILIFSIVIFAVNTFLGQWFDPRFSQKQNKKMLMELGSKVDSLSFEIDRKDRFINIFKTMLDGGEIILDDSMSTSGEKNVTNVDIDYKEPILEKKACWTCISLSQ